MFLCGRDRGDILFCLTSVGKKDKAESPAPSSDFDDGGPPKKKVSSKTFDAVWVFFVN